MSSNPVEVFYSYVDADEDLCLELDKHLSTLQSNGLITTFHRHDIQAGTDWRSALDKHLDTAAVILLLVSADFLSSDYCSGTELQRAMERNAKGSAHVIPVLLRPVDWQSAPFGHLQALPSNGMPVTSWPNRDEAFLDVASGIRSVLQEGKLPPSVTPSPTLPPIWNIPYPRNPFFTGQEEMLKRIESQLQSGQAAALSQAQAISGLGGIVRRDVA